MSFRPEPFRCDISAARASAIVVCHGELDLATVDQAREALRSVLSKRSVTLDLRNLRFIDSTGLRLVLEIDALARQDGFNFFVVRAPATVQRIFAITGMEDHIAFIDAPDDLSPPQSVDGRCADGGPWTNPRSRMPF